MCEQCGKAVEDDPELVSLHKLFRKRLCKDCLSTCESCSAKVDDLQKVELSGIRWRQRLCTTCFDAKKQKKAS